MFVLLWVGGGGVQRQRLVTAENCGSFASGDDYHSSRCDEEVDV